MVMANSGSGAVHLGPVRALVRYVDEQRAVVDTQVSIERVLPPIDVEADDDMALEVLLEINGEEGFHDEKQAVLTRSQPWATLRMEVVYPERWWPAGMGGQPLYQLTVHLLYNEELVESWSTTLGLTSVRRTDVTRDALLINGQQRDIKEVIPFDKAGESALLPVTGHTLLLVRDHYGAPMLYEAADRAGILMLQCVPIHPEGWPEMDMHEQVDRLAPHPSLAGWFVGHLGEISDELAESIRQLDPTHPVFRRVPGIG